MYHSRPLVHLARSTPLGGRALHRQLKATLHRYAVYVPPSTSANAGRGERQSPVPLDRLTDRVVEQVLTKGCVAGSLSAPRTSGNEAMDVDSTEDVIEDDSGTRILSAIQARYGSSAFPAQSFRIPHSEFTRDGQGTLVVPGWILERSAEILFDPDLSEEAESVPQAVLDTLLKVRPGCHRQSQCRG